MKVEIERWTPDIETGIAWQDSQHEELLGKIGFFHQAILVKKGREEIQKIINLLDEQVEHHFAEEEKHMKRIRYPEADIHQKEHKTFADGLANLMAVYEKRSDYTDAFAMSVCMFLNQWLINHIKTHDIRLGLFLQLNELGGFP